MLIVIRDTSVIPLRARWRCVDHSVLRLLTKEVDLIIVVAVLGRFSYLIHITSYQCRPPGVTIQLGPYYFVEHELHYYY